MTLSESMKKTESELWQEALAILNTAELDIGKLNEVARNGYCGGYIKGFQEGRNLFASFLETARKELRHYFCERYRINKKGRSWCEDVTDLCFSCRKIDAVFGGEEK